MYCYSIFFSYSKLEGFFFFVCVYEYHVLLPVYFARNTLEIIPDKVKML